MSSHPSASFIFFLLFTFLFLSVFVAHCVGLGFILGSTNGFCMLQFTYFLCCLMLKHSIMIFSKEKMDASKLSKMFSVELLPSINGTSEVAWTIDKEMNKAHFDGHVVMMYLP